MLSDAEIDAALAAGYEFRYLELKGPGPATDSHLFAKVAKAALGLGNLRDGGQVVIGIDDKDPAARAPGLSPEQLATWRNYDHVSSRLANYADPPLRFDLRVATLSSDAAVIVINVYEFADVPHLCAKSYDKPTEAGPSERVLRKGALYVRPRKGIETSEVSTAVDMRDIIELATDKALRGFVGRAERAGLELRTARDAGDRFEAERAEGWAK